ncbi:MAG TPA: YcxB family protein [Pyrinomonadaceae bacterium]|nr:YcxB family protein [Pyrinomonadaceae bacterium]
MTETNEPLIVDVDLNESDLQRANFWFALKGWSNLLMLAIMPIAGLLLLWKVDLSRLSQHPLAATGAIIFLGFPPFYLAMIWFRTKRGFANLKDYQTKVQYAFFPNGYKVSDAKCSGNIDWDAIPRAAESKYSFHIFLSKTCFHTIPKRSFKQAEDMVRFRGLLKQSLGSKAALS